MQTVRNVAIIAALAFVVAAVPGGGETAEVVLAIISMAFLAAMTWAAYRLYHEREMTLMSMTDGQRALFLGAIAAIILLFVGAEEFSQRDGGMLVWVALMAGAIATIFFTVRSTMDYS